MDYLFTPNNLKVLESFSLVETFYAFDYDGTLAPICNSPDNAKMSPEISKLISELNSLVPVGIITGRGISDIKKLLNFEPRFIIGNHGLEGSHSDDELKEMHLLSRLWLEKLSKYEVSHLAPLKINIEDKKYSLSLHYRSSHSPFDAEQVCNTIASELPGAKITRGKSVVNIVPLKGMNKGEAMERILQTQNFNFGFFIGDDETDEEVFKCKSPQVLTVKVGKDDRTKAKYYLETQSEVEKLLTLIVSFQKNKFLVTN